MSILANITIHLTKNKAKQNSLDKIETLINAGWTLNDHGKFSYLPIGDQDNFDWHIQDDISFFQLTEIIKAKEQSKETVGIVMTWETTLIGGTVLIYQNETISINLDINRKTIVFKDNYIITDFQWYLERLLPQLNETFGVAHFSCGECR